MCARVPVAVQVKVAPRAVSVDTPEEESDPKEPRLSTLRRRSKNPDAVGEGVALGVDVGLGSTTNVHVSTTGSQFEMPSNVDKVSVVTTVGK